MSKESRLSLRQSLMGISPEEMSLRRQATFLEILTTEENYVNDLQLVINYFIEPIRRKEILDKEMVAKVFSNWEELLLKVNRPFLEKLKSLESPANVGMVFLEFADLFKMYAVYCSNQARIGEVIEQAKQSPELKKLDEMSLDDPKTRNQGLRDFLILPMQRVCRYPMLLESLVKYTEVADVELDALKEAIYRYKALVAQINEWTRRVENVIKLTEIEQKFKDGKTLGLVQPRRHVVWHGRLKMRLPRSLGISSNMEVDLQDGARCFLFDDLLISAAPIESGGSKSLLSVKFTLDLTRCFNVHVEDISDDTNKAGEEVGFEVIFQISSESDPSKSYQKKFKFKAVSAADRDVWIKKFRELPLLLARRDVAELSQINHHLSGTSAKTGRKPFTKTKSQGKDSGTTDSKGDASSPITGRTANTSVTGDNHVGLSLKLPQDSSNLRAASLSARSHLTSSSSSSNLFKHSINSNGAMPPVSARDKPAGRRGLTKASVIGNSRAVHTPASDTASGSKEQVELIFEDDDDKEGESPAAIEGPVHPVPPTAASNTTAAASRPTPPQGGLNASGGQYKRPIARRVTGAPPNLPLPNLPTHSVRFQPEQPHTVSTVLIVTESPKSSAHAGEESQTSSSEMESISELPVRHSGLSSTSPRLSSHTAHPPLSHPTRSASTNFTSASKKIGSGNLARNSSKDDLLNDGSGDKHVVAKPGPAYGRFSGNANHHFGAGPGPLHIPPHSFAGLGAGPSSPPPLSTSPGSSSFFAMSPLTSPTPGTTPTAFSSLVNQQWTRDYESLALGFIQALQTLWPSESNEVPTSRPAVWDLLRTFEEDKSEQLEGKEHMRRAITLLRRKIEMAQPSISRSASVGSVSGHNGHFDHAEPDMNGSGYHSTTNYVPASSPPGRSYSISSLDSFGDFLTSITAGGPPRGVSSATSPRLNLHSTSQSETLTRVTSPKMSLARSSEYQTGARSPPMTKSTRQHSAELEEDDYVIVDDRLTPRKAEPSDMYSHVRRQNSGGASRRSSYSRSISYAGHTANVAQSPAPPSPRVTVSQSTQQKDPPAEESPRPDWQKSTSSLSSSHSSDLVTARDSSPTPKSSPSPTTSKKPLSNSGSRVQSPPPRHPPPPTPTSAYSSSPIPVPASNSRQSPRTRGSSVKVPESSSLGSSPKTIKRLSGGKESPKKGKR